MTESEYPKVLFITPCAFNHITGGGATFSSLFSGWAAGRLAAITDDIVPVSMDVCKEYYFLSKRERSFIRPFGWLYREKKKEGNNPPLSHNNKKEPGGALGKIRGRLSGLANNIIGDAGIPDRGVLTPALYKRIKEFQPDVIYTILGTIGYMEIVEQVYREFRVPLIIHLMDDGVTDPQKKGIFGRYLREKYNKKFRSILKLTTSRFAICEDMAEAYKERYGYPFIHFQHTVDIDKWSHLSRQDISIGDSIRVAYAGSIYPFAHLQSLKDCCQAVNELSREGINISMDIYTPLSLFKPYTDTFIKSDAIHIYDAVTEEEEFLKILAGADVLLLPANFDSDSIQFIRYSMPTKVPPYLLSGTPIFVYGPETIAQVKYARREKWGYVVSERGIRFIKKGLLELINNKKLRQEISSAARRVARKNHDSKVVRKRFQDAIKSCSGGA